MAYADTVYPKNLRALLEGLGFDRIYRQDVDSAVAAACGASDFVGAAVGRATRPKRDRPRLKITSLARDAVFLLATLAGGYILFDAWPKLTHVKSPRSPPEATIIDAPFKEASRCLQRRWIVAIRWCQQALIGSPKTQLKDTDLGGQYGTDLAERSATVRQALNGILDDGAQRTYTASDAERRCAEAAGSVIEQQ
jgi:hypothetical protein